MTVEIELERKSSDHTALSQEPVSNGPLDSEKQPQLSEEEVAYTVNEVDGIKLLEQVIEEHQFDQNFPHHILERAAKLLKEEQDGHVSEEHVRHLLEEIQTERNLLLNDSPYPEVRAVVDNTDDTNIPCNTFRAWFLGLFLSIVGTAINALFSFRMPGIYISQFVAQLVSYSMGKGLARVLPTRHFSLGAWRFTLNPGPFSQKEHILITVMATVSLGGAYVTDLFVVQRLPMFFNQNEAGSRAGYQILLTLSTQLIGYSCAGMTRRFLVYPAQMIWPENLAAIALTKALHRDDGRVKEPVKGPFKRLWSISRHRFMLLSILAMFVYFWLPDFLFQALSYFSWITWLAPKSVMVALIAGSQSGLGLNPWTTFDWNIATTLFDPIITPLFSTINIAAGMILMAPLIAIVFFTNTWNTGYLPIVSNHIFDNTATHYNVSKILTSQGLFDQAKYDAYSPAYYSSTNALVYGAYFVLYSALITHTVLYHRQPIWLGIRSVFRWKAARESHNDVHNRLMSKYQEAPEWWYASVLIISIVFGIVAVKVYDTGMPIWGVFFAVALCITLQIPIGIITAVSNAEIGLNVLAEFIGGMVTPGNPLALMIFKTYGAIATSQSIAFSKDLKMGHYMKIPPRVMFAAQSVATVISSLVSVAVTDWAIENIPNLCSKHQINHFTCPGSNTFFSAAVIWGALGPKRIYGAGGIYHILTVGFLIGLVLPVPFFFLTRRWPNSWVRNVHIPVLLIGCHLWVPYNLSYLWPAVIFALFFNWYLKRNYVLWWERYAYVLSTSWSVGIALAGVLIFFAVQYHPVDVNWWGNNIVNTGCDAEGCPWMELPASGHF